LITGEKAMMATRGRKCERQRGLSLRHHRTKREVAAATRAAAMVESRLNLVSAELLNGV